MNNGRRPTTEQRRVLERYGLPASRRRKRLRISPLGRDILLSWLIIACLFLLLGFFLGAVVVERDVQTGGGNVPAVSVSSLPLSALQAAEEPETVAVEEEPIQAEQIAAEKPTNAGIAFEWDAAAHGYVSLGEFKLTSYCACEKCCGYWATIRPLDENGEPIVYTASGAVARQGVTVAADTDLLPFGTVLLIGGEEFVVQDVGGAVDGKHIDIYFEDHQAAVAFGVKYKEIFKEGEAA